MDPKPNMGTRKHPLQRKTACQNCTISKVRCGLEKPTCSRCWSRSRQCRYLSGLGDGSSPVQSSERTQQMGASALIHRLQTFPLFRRQQRSLALCLAMRRIYRTPTLHVHLCKRRTHVLILMMLNSFQWQMRKISAIAGCSLIFSLRRGSFLSCSTRLPCSSLPACFAHTPIIYSRRKASLHSFTHCKLATKQCHGQ